MKHKLFPYDALARGTMCRAVVDGVAVVVVHTPAGDLRAMRDICPHRQARLSNGLLQEMVTGDEIGKRALTAEMVVLRCPWHGFEFDVDTGRCLADPDRVRVRTYSVTVEDGFITVER